MNGCGFEALILGILQLNQTFLTAGLDSKFYFFVIAIKFFYLFYLFFCSVVDMFREALAGAYLIIVEDIPADPPAEQPQRRAVQEIELPQQHQASEGGLRHPCVVCLDAEAIFIALFCCHVSACADCLQALHANRVGTCPTCREPAIYFLRIYVT